MPAPPELVEEAHRQLTICNACRYCEGYCAVFPAAERRAIFLQGDVAMLANLCHDCRACYQACMYTPPHEFALNIPKLMAEARVETYREYAWPGAMAALLRRPVLAAASLTALGVGLALLAVLVGGHWGALLTADGRPGAFYRVIGWGLMMGTFMVVSVAVLAVAAIGFARLWRDAGGTARELRSPRLWWGTAGDVVRLRYLGGGGGGCHHPDPQHPSQSRRILHQHVAGGFLLAFAATVAAAVYQDILGMLPPYAVLSVPVLLGILGGVGIIAGAIGLLWTELRGAERAERLRWQPMRAMDLTFLVMLLAVAATGMALLIVRDSAAMGILLLLHLGTIAALYATAPYGKFVHALHRTAALLLDRAEAAREA